MSSASLPHGDRDYAIYLPRISRSLLDDLAAHLSQCCQEHVARTVVDPVSDYLTAKNEVACARPSSAELDSALRTVERAALLMGEFQALARPLDEYEEIERGLLLLKSRLSAYERGFDILAEQLRFAKDEAEGHKRRSVAAEHKLEVLMSAVSRIFDMLPAKLTAVGASGKAAS